MLDPDEHQARRLPPWRPASSGNRPRVRTERVIGGDEVGQKLVQAGLEDRIDAAVSEPRVDLAGQPWH